MGSRGDLTDAQWARLEPLLPVSNRQRGRWRDHRQVINGVLYRVQWRDLPERLRAGLPAHPPRLSGAAPLVPCTLPAN
jgi:transposase